MTAAAALTAAMLLASCADGGSDAGSGSGAGRLGTPTATTSEPSLTPTPSEWSPTPTAAPTSQQLRPPGANDPLANGPAPSVADGTGGAHAAPALAGGFRLWWRAPVPLRLPPAARAPVVRPWRALPPAHLSPTETITTASSMVQRVEAHLTGPAASQRSLELDAIVSRWARDVTAAAETGAGSVAERALPASAEPLLHTELRQLTLDFLKGLWCSYMEYVVLQPPPEESGEPRIDVRKALEDAVWARASRALSSRLGTVVAWQSYVEGLAGTIDNVADRTTFRSKDGRAWQVDPRESLRPDIAPFLVRVPAAVQVAGPALVEGVVFWYRLCYAPPGR